MKKYMVKNIFGPTLQGEGSHSGSVVNFLRFAGCNRWTGLEKDREKSICHFCDTDFRGGVHLSINDILSRLALIGSTKKLVISGGEASLQLNRELLSALKNEGYEVHLETNGSNNLDHLRDLIHHITMSPKQSITATKLKSCDDLKLLYPSIHPAITPESFANFPAKSRFLQPVWDQNYKSNLTETISCLYSQPDWRLSLQVHKITGVE